MGRRHRFTGVARLDPRSRRTTDPRDLALRGWVKHDGKRLYFAFDITDDVLYGIDTPRWLPDENPKAHELTPGLSVVRRRDGVAHQRDQPMVRE